MRRGIGYATVTAAACAGILFLIGVVVITVILTVPLSAAEEDPAQVVPVTLWDDIRAMGWSGPVLVGLLGLALVAIVVNLAQQRRVHAYLAPAGSAPADIAASTERFLIAPGALLGIGTMAVVIGGLGTASGFTEMLNIIARSWTSPTAPRLFAGFAMGLVPASAGFFVGALAIASGLIFRGLVALRRAKLIAACAKG
ncbi:MAG: hypothetical protein JXP34_06140 [Planctomycetes bacterium]|nr:hypothetical protein [Planctomycetota bacterium]